MTTLLVSPQNADELNLIEEVLHKMGIATKELSDEEKEDIGLSILMKQADRSRKVSRETIMKKLKSQ